MHRYRSVRNANKMAAAIARWLILKSVHNAKGIFSSIGVSLALVTVSEVMYKDHVLSGPTVDR